MGQGLEYSVDIVFCIDATGSMGPVIGKVKEAALRFHDDLQKVMNEKNKNIDKLRARVIVFRDYWADGERSMQESPFFALPAEQDGFAQFVRTIVADGGGDEPENGLEGLALAINSPWAKSGDKRRELVVVWTDASAHSLEKGSKPSNYPSGMPGTFDDLTDMWEGQKHMSKNGKRLIIYAPDADPWTTIANHWENTIHFPSKAGSGLEEFTYLEILNAVANSI